MLAFAYLALWPENLVLSDEEKISKFSWMRPKKTVIAWLSYILSIFPSFNFNFFLINLNITYFKIVERSDPLL